MIIFDENIEEHWIQIAKKAGLDYISIRENCYGITDREVIEVAKSKKGLIVTEDKDFGELIFSYGIKNVSVMFMRYDQPQYSQIEQYFIKCLLDYLENPQTCFITISKNKIRIRKM
jgi:predicted nuclease of predicted toxin-antitoxin system